MLYGELQSFERCCLRNKISNESKVENVLGASLLHVLENFFGILKSRETLDIFRHIEYI